MHINQNVFERLQDLRSPYITHILMLSNVFSWSEVSTLFSFNTWTLLCALSVLPGKGGWLCARLNLACKYSHLSLLLTSREVLQERHLYSRTSMIQTSIIRISQLSRLFLWSQFGLASHANVLRGSSRNLSSPTNVVRGGGKIAWWTPKNVCVGG